MTNTIERIKIGSEYYRNGYGRSKPVKANVYLINGFCYAKDKANEDTQYNPIPAEIGLSGYVRVNIMRPYNTFHQCTGHSDLSKHIPYDNK